MTDPHIDLEPLSRGTARLVLADLEDDEHALDWALVDMSHAELVASVRELIAGWIAVMVIALRDEGMPQQQTRHALENALRGHLGRDLQP